MLGIIFGTVCLIAFIGVLRRRFGRGCHGRRFGRGRHFGRGYFGMYRLFEELDTSPGQEKAIRGAVAELRASFGELRPSVKETKHSVAQAIHAEAFDGPALEQAFEGHIGDVSRLGKALSVAIGKVHEALDPDQRRRLARFIDSLPYGHAF